MLNYQTYRLRKEAEWLVFIHGAGGGISSWKYQVEAFRPYFNLLILDLRDHGRSKNISPHTGPYNFDLICGDIFEVIDHLQIQQAHFMTLSLGSAIFQKLALQRPELPLKLIMAGGIFRASFLMKLAARSAWIINRLLPYRYMYALFSWVVMPKKNHQTSRKLYQREAQKLSPAEYLRWVGLYREFFEVLDQFFQQKMKQLSLVVMGAEDHIFIRSAQRFAQHQARVNMVVFDKCGHICNIEQWQQFNRVALSFLTATK